jgi:peptidoglycan/xylan/chitin deacetylase (PgdA/CDA1 family)
VINRTRLKQLYFQLLWLARIDRRLLKEIRRRDLLLILNLHQISPEPNPFWSPLSPQAFDELLGFLRQHFHLTLFRHLGAVQDERPSVVLSFDDGYYNFVEYAMPILDKHGLAANMNVIPACVASGEPPWNVRLYDFLNSAPRQLIEELRLPGFDHRLADNSTESKLRYGLKISRFLKNRPRHEREELWPAVAALMSKAPNVKATRMMSAADVRAAAGTHEIGAHSYSHESMQFEDERFFEDDFQKCVNYFRAELRLPLSVYAFPNGSYRPEQITYLERQDVQYILLVGEQYARRQQKVLPRFTIYGDTPTEVKIRALGYGTPQATGESRGAKVVAAFNA